MFGKVNLIILLFIGINSFSQNITSSSQIIEFLGSERYAAELTNNPGLIYYLDARVQFGYSIIDVIPGKESDFKTLDQIPTISKEGGSISAESFLQLYTSGALNILMYNFPVAAQTNGYFALGNSGKAIVIYSVEYVNSKIVQP